MEPTLLDVVDEKFIYIEYEPILSNDFYQYRLIGLSNRNGEPLYLFSLSDKKPEDRFIWPPSHIAIDYNSTVLNIGDEVLIRMTFNGSNWKRLGDIKFPNNYI